MNDELKHRLNRIAGKITSNDFLTNRGLGNEIGFYIFEYPPECEIEVRNFIPIALDQVSRNMPGLRLSQVNLFNLIVDYLNSRKLLDRCIKVQTEKGNAELLNALKDPLKEERIAPVFIKVAKPEENDAVLVTGVGNSFPLIRTHTLLNNLHHLMKGKPLVVFYPGLYDGQGLRLFNRIENDNYYRAFRLVP
jgi:hypothetical protein